MQTLRDVLSRLMEERLDLGRSFLQQLDIALTHLERTLGKPARIAEIDAAAIRTMMRDLMQRGRTNRTVNNYRASIFYLLDAAETYGANRVQVRRKDIPRLAIHDPWPTAWRPEELEAIIASCRAAKTKRGWGAEHWESLVLTIYDTSLRIGCLMRSVIDQIDRRNCMLHVPGTLQKGRRSTLQPLHPDTCEKLLLLRRPSGDRRLFPWPFHKDEIWRKFTREVLIPANLPATYRDKFHRIRRTSYTYVTKAFGKEAASQHAAHREDLSRFYLDVTLLDRPNPLDALPRPRPKG